MGRELTVAGGGALVAGAKSSSLDIKKAMDIAIAQHPPTARRKVHVLLTQTYAQAKEDPMFADMHALVRHFVNDCKVVAFTYVDSSGYHFWFTGGDHLQVYRECLERGWKPAIWDDF